MHHIHGGNIEAAKREYNLREDEIIDFSANINFLGPPPRLLEALQRNITEVARYPEPGSIRLKRELAADLNPGPEQLVIGNGAAEIIYKVIEVLQPRVTLIPVPSFSEYACAVNSANRAIKYFPLAENREKGEFRLPVERFIKNFPEIEAAFICNPHNPTGLLLKKEELTEILRAARAGDVFLLIDEAFIDFVTADNDCSLLNLVDRYENIFVIRSLTKFFAIPGLRLGYGVGTPEIIMEIEENRDPWTVNILAQRAGEIACSEKEYKRKTKKLNEREREYLYYGLKRIPWLKPYLPAANFIFARIKDNYISSGRLKEELAAKGLLIRDCSSYYGLNDRYFRAAVKNRDNNKRLLKELERVE